MPPNRLVFWISSSMSASSSSRFCHEASGSSDDTNLLKFRADSAAILNCSINSARSTDLAAWSFPKLSRSRAKESSRDAIAEGHSEVILSSQAFSSLSYFPSKRTLLVEPVQYQV